MKQRAVEAAALVAALVAVMRAKGASSEMRYAHQLDGHRRLRRSLEALTSA